MKKLFLSTIFTTLRIMPVCAADYIITSDKPVKAVYVRNEEILSAKPLYTLDNSKENIIISVKKDGKTAILVNRFDEEIILEVKVKKGEINIKNADGFEYFPIDTPPEKLEILPPPAKKNQNEN